MKILFLADAHSIHTIRWVNALTDLGHNVYLVYLKNHSDKKKMLKNQIKTFPLPISGTKGYYLNAIYLKKLMNKINPDIVNVHYASGYGTLARVAKLPAVILNVWGSDVYDFPYESKLKQKILRKNLNYAVEIVSTSYSMAQQTKKFLNTERNIPVTPFGVDIMKFRPNENERQSKKFIFGTVKTLSYKYGIDIVIRAFYIFLQKQPNNLKENIVLEIYGEGDLSKELKSLVKRLRLENNIFFNGEISNDEVAEVLRGMDVFLLGSRLESESFGVAAVEAMASGLPVIATCVSGFKEVIEDKVSGFLVPIDDVQAMAKYMAKLFYNVEIRRKVGIEGRKRVEKLYNWKDNVSKLEEVYLNIYKTKNY